MESVKNWLGAVGAVFYGVLAWFSGIWLGLTGSKLWALRIGLIAIGLAAVGAILLWLRSRQAGQKAGGEAASSDESGPLQEEIDFLIRATAERLKSSKLKMGSLPVILLAGEPGTGKTTTMLNSGLEPEHLAGQLLQEDRIVPTRPVNIWFARQALFVEAGGTLLGEPASWARLVRRLAPAKFRSILSGKGQAARAALVCFDCEEFTRRGAAETIGAAVKNLQRRLAELSQALGINLPVYVLFNKLDRLPFFAEYVANLTNPEISEVLGVTLPIEAGLTTGVYAEHQTRRLTTAFEDIFRSLAEKRIEYLPREAQEANWPGIYEFPREFNKLKGPMVQLLVDLCRPSQLTVSPFLRGFYFAGRRTVLVEEGGALLEEAPSEAWSEPSGAPVGATRVFDVRQLKRVAGEQPAGASAGATRVFDVGKLGSEATFVGGIRAQGRETREVQQWTFLTHLFSDVLLVDRGVFGSSAASTKVNFWRRLLLALAAVALLVWTIGLVVSYFGNRALLSAVRNDRASSFSPAPPTQAPSVSDLNRLNYIGESLDTLSGYHRSGVPLSLRWGLYLGNELYPQACRAYARGLNQLLLGPTRVAMVSYLRGLSYKADTGLAASTQNPQTSPYDGPYNTLKTYLIATNQGSHVREDSSFTSDLYASWPPRQNVTADQERLVKQQLDRYGTQLASSEAAGCFDATPDPDAVTNARNYLNSFPPAQRIYQAMLADATSKGGKAIDFNKEYADQAATDGYPVRPAFTKAGWGGMDDALKHPQRYRGGEQWVLGSETPQVADPQKYVPDLRRRYVSEFTGEWLSFIKAGKFAGYKNPADISPKIAKVASAHSALLMVLCVAAQNTNVGDKDVDAAFSSVRGLVPQDCETKVIGVPNKGYTESLFDLEGCLDKMGRATGDEKEANRKQCQDKADEAQAAVRKLLAQNAGLDQVDAAVQALLSAPINAPTLQAQLKAPPPPGAGDLCDALKALAAKLPFKRGASAEATLPDFTQVFGSDGLIVKHRPDPAGSLKPNPRFVSFYNHVADIQRALYPNGKDLRLSYRIGVVSLERVPSFSLAIGGSTLTPTTGPKYFVWTGNAQETVSLSVPQYPPISEAGPWAIFKFLDKYAEPGQLAPSSYTFAIPITVGVPTQSSPRLKLFLDAGAATELFASGRLASLSCVTKVTQ